MSIDILPTLLTAIGGAPGEVSSTAGEDGGTAGEHGGTAEETASAMSEYGYQPYRR